MIILNPYYRRLLIKSSFILLFAINITFLISCGQIISNLAETGTIYHPRYLERREKEKAEEEKHKKFIEEFKKADEESKRNNVYKTSCKYYKFKYQSSGDLRGPHLYSQAYESLSECEYAIRHSWNIRLIESCSCQ